MTTEDISNTQQTRETETGHGHEMDEHNYDGIEELDNPPPGWIMFIFYLTIGISILYGAYYFWIGIGPDQYQEYERSVQQAQLKYQSDLPTVALSLLTDEVSLAEGRTIYADMNCAACHGVEGEGNAIGPNLIDEYWIHGCSFDEVFNIIKNGEPLKGMTPFKALLSDERIQKVSSYVLVSMKEYTPANPKEPQGEQCE
jgi:cytochrome c oxidase cbb3-type subunit III